MVADKRRILRPGHEFDALIPAASGTLAGQRRWGGSHDSVAGVRQYASEFMGQTKALAEKLRGTSTRQTCQNIWEFIYRHIQYKNDAPGFEQIRSPARSWSERKTGVDCDDYSIITSSILLNLGILHLLRMTDYGRGKGWQHIYVIVPKSGSLSRSLDQRRRDEYIVIDAVTDQFDYEVKYAKNEDFKMDIQFLQGLEGAAGPGPDYTVDGLGTLGKTIFGKALQKVGGAAKAVAKVAVKVTTTPVRLGTLAILKFNIKKGAARLRYGYVPYGPLVAKSNYGPQAHAKIVSSLKKLIGIFKGLGGDANALRMAILTGAGNKSRLIPSNSNQPGLGALLAQDADWQALQQINSIYDPMPDAPGLEGLSGSGLGIDPATLTLITAAMAAFSPILNMLAGAKAGDPNDPIPAEYIEYVEEQPEEEYAEEEEGTGGLGAVRAALKKAVVKPAVAKSKAAAPAKVAATVAAKKATAPVKAPVKAVAKAPAPAPAPRLTIDVKPIAAKTTITPLTTRPVIMPTASKPITATLPTSLVKAPVVVRPTAQQIVAKAKSAGILTKVASIFKKKDPVLKAAKAEVKAEKKVVKTAAKVEKAAVKTEAKAAKSQAKDAKKALRDQVRVAKGVAPVNPVIPPIDVTEFATPPLIEAPVRSQPAASVATAIVRAVAPAPAPQPEPDYDMPDDGGILPQARPTTKEEKVAQVVAKKKTKVGAAIQNVAQTVKEVAQPVARQAAENFTQAIVAPLIKAPEDVIDFSAETAEQAALDLDSGLPDLPPPPPKTGGLSLDFFNDKDGKPDLLKIGGTAVGLLVAGKLLFGGNNPPQPYYSRRRGLSGTPGAGKKAKQTAKSTSGRDASGRFTGGSSAKKAATRPSQSQRRKQQSSSRGSGLSAVALT